MYKSNYSNNFIDHWNIVSDMVLQLNCKRKTKMIKPLETYIYQDKHGNLYGADCPSQREMFKKNQ